MFNKFLIISVFVLLFDGIASSQPLEVTYLGNEGFLIHSGEQSILIDGLFGTGLDGYPVAPENLRAQMEKAQGPFKDLDIILASHHHPDHFDAGAVSRHLINNPASRFFSTAQATQKLRDTEMWKQIESRVQIAIPAEGKTLSFEHGGIKLTAYNLHHGKGMARPAENIGWLMEIGGKRIMHLGDTVITSEEASPLRLSQERLDLALVPSWYYTEPDLKDFLRQIPASATIIMHLPETDAPSDYFGSRMNHKNLLTFLRQQIKASDWIPLVPSESRRFK